MEQRIDISTDMRGAAWKLSQACIIRTGRPATGVDHRLPPLNDLPPSPLDKPRELTQHLVSVLWVHIKRFGSPNGNGPNAHRKGASRLGQDAEHDEGSNFASPDDVHAIPARL
jgi:hypothetical protein